MNYSGDMPKIGPYSRAAALAKLDGRTREARLMRATREELLKHIGSNPSATQRMLVEQAVQVALRIAVMDRRFAEAGEQTEHDSKTYLAWANSYGRLLHRLGMKGAAERAPNLRDYLAGKSAAA